MKLLNITSDGYTYVTCSPQSMYFTIYHTTVTESTNIVKAIANYVLFNPTDYNNLPNLSNYTFKLQNNKLVVDIVAFE